MAFKCGFFNSVNGDRKYNAEDMMNPIKGIVSDGIVADDLYSDGLQVQSYNGLEIIVKKGYGKFHNKWCENDADMVIAIPTPHVTETRIDSVIIKINLDTRTGTLEYKQGTTVAPELERTNSVMEYRLANITVAPNVTEITQADIEDTRPTAECGFVTNLLQNSDISATYSQWQEQFEAWFNHLKEEVASTTLIRSFTSNYVSVEDEETTIPINIPRYVVETDILQVYINGILLIPNVEYIINDYQSIELINGIKANNNVSFIVYKSIDGTGAETIVEEVERLSADIENIKARLTPLSYSSVYTAENNNETNIPINISAFNSNSDVLQVFVNGLKLVPDIDYTLNDFQSITLAKGIDNGTVVSFFLLKFL